MVSTRVLLTTVIMLISVGTLGCSYLGSPEVKADVIGHSLDFDVSNMRVQIKATVKAINTGNADAEDCSVSVLVKTSDGIILGSNTVDFGSIPRGSSKVKDIYITLSLGNLPDLFLSLLKGQVSLKYETEISCK